jgi:glutamate-1-semialdehyde aminotransferase
MNNKGQLLYQKARRIIPGGTQLLSKRPELFLPERWPSYYAKAKGIEVWDLDGTRYIDMSYMGIGACILGYADPDVDAAVKAAIDSGSMCTLNCPEELQLADLLFELHPWAQMVRYARTGGEVMAVAVRIARAKTRRDKVAFCGYHGWHDWYLAANLGEKDVLDGHLLPGLQPVGVPRSLLNTAFTFHYNKVDELKSILTRNPNEIAAVVMEPVRNFTPAPGFLEEVKELAAKAGAVLIFDEISSGWRLTAGGAHLVYKVTPDVAVFAKAMSNGYPMAAVIGIADVMRAAEDSFISSTYWTERVGFSAAIATIEKLRRQDAASHLVATGNRILRGWRQEAEAHHLNIETSGIPPLAHFTFNYPNGQAVRTLFTQEMLKKGYLATNAFYACLSHRSEDVNKYLKTAGEVFAMIADLIKVGKVEQMLEGPVAHAGFYRLT